MFPVPARLNDSELTEFVSKYLQDAGYVPGNGGGGSVAIANRGPLRVVSLGDSNCFGWGLTPWSSFAEAACSLSGGKLLHVNNGGVGGETSSQIVSRFNTAVLPYKPDVVIAQIGTNDSANQATVIKWLTALANRALAQDSMILVMCSTFPRSATGYPALTLAIQALAASFGTSRIRYANTHDALLSGGVLNPAYTSDGIHLNTTGGLVAGGPILSALSDILANVTPMYPMLTTATNANNTGENPIQNGCLDTDATNWQANGTGITLSRGTDDGNYARFSFAASSYGYAQINPPASLSSLSKSVGRRVFVCGKVRVIGTPTGATLNIIPYYCDTANPSGTSAAQTALTEDSQGWQFFYKEFDCLTGYASSSSGLQLFSASASATPFTVDFKELQWGISPAYTGPLSEGALSLFKTSVTSRNLNQLDHGKTVNITATQTITIPAGLLVTEKVDFAINGAFTLTITGAAGVTVNGTSAGSVAFSTAYGIVRLRKVGTNAWVVA